MLLFPFYVGFPRVYRVGWAGKDSFTGKRLVIEPILCQVVCTPRLGSSAYFPIFRSQLEAVFLKYKTQLPYCPPFINLIALRANIPTKTSFIIQLHCFNHCFDSFKCLHRCRYDLIGW